MKALTINQPYASLIADGLKWVENRTWYTGYRGRLAIHAGKGTRYLTSTELTQYPSGIIAVCRLIACVRLGDIRHDERSVRIAFSSHTFGQLLDHEYTEGPWCWVLDDVRKLHEPIPARGRQGLWEWTGNVS